MNRLLSVLPGIVLVAATYASRAEDPPAFSRFHFAGHTLTGSELLRGLERAAASLGVAPEGGFRHGGVPWPLLRLGGLVVPMLREVAEMSYLWRVPHALDGTALRNTVGELASTPVDAALRAALVALGFGSTKSAAGLGFAG